MEAEEFKRLPNWLRGALVVGLIAVIGFLRLDVTSDIEFKSGRVLAVEPILDRPWDRFVTVQVDSAEVTLRVTEPAIKTTFGQLVCVQSNKRLIRQGRRYGLALPVYCRNDGQRQSALAATD